MQIVSRQKGVQSVQNKGHHLTLPPQVGWDRLHLQQLREEEQPVVQQLRVLSPPSLVVQPRHLSPDHLVSLVGVGDPHNLLQWVGQLETVSVGILIFHF